MDRIMLASEILKIAKEMVAKHYREGDWVWIWDMNALKPQRVVVNKVLPNGKVKVSLGGSGTDVIMGQEYLFDKPPKSKSSPKWNGPGKPSWWQD